MAKWASDPLILDLILERVDDSILMCICSAQPNTRNEAVTTYALTTIAMSASDFTIANGVSSGRRVTVAAKNGAVLTASGNANHVALVDGGNLLYVSTISNAQDVLSGNIISTLAWDIEISDPA